MGRGFVDPVVRYRGERFWWHGGDAEVLATASPAFGRLFVTNADDGSVVEVLVDTHLSRAYRQRRRTRSTNACSRWRARSRRSAAARAYTRTT